MDRRSFCLSSLAGIVGIPGTSSVHAQGASGVPEGALTVYAGFPAGTAVDALARAIAEQARQQLGNRAVIVENQPGATGMISLQKLKRAKADGSIVGLVPLTSSVIAPMFKSKVDFNILSDYEPVAMVGHYALAFSVANTVPVHDWKGFVEWGKQHPDQLFYGHGGPGSMAQLVGAAIADAAQLKFQDVPFKGDADALAACIGGQLQTVITSTVAVNANYQAKRLKTLAVTSRQRVSSMPEVPTFSELGFPGAISEPWMGIFAPKGTPASAVAVWNKVINTALADGNFQRSLFNQGYVLAGGTPESLRATVTADTARWRKVMDAAGFKAVD